MGGKTIPLEENLASVYVSPKPVKGQYVNDFGEFEDYDEETYFPMSGE